MKEESCGAVIYHRDKILLLHYDASHWGFCKGNREHGETKLETAKREIKEETGLTDLDFSDFEREITYFYKREGIPIHKKVTYFLCESKDQKVTLSSEHTGFEWLSYQEALEKLTFHNTREVLQAAKSHLDASQEYTKLQL